MTLNTADPRPLYNQAEINITGNPTTTICPVGNGIQFADEDHVVYKFPVSEPWPCPFDINNCSTGFTLSFWFKWDYIVRSYFRFYISLGDTFSLYRARAVTASVVSLKWKADGKFAWFYAARCYPNRWNLITWKVNHTHSVGYRNGLKIVERLKNPPKVLTSGITSELHLNKNLNAGNFSVGPMQLWAGGKSPVFIWRLFQEGLKDYGKNWEFLCNVEWNDSVSNHQPHHCLLNRSFGRRSK